MVAKTIRQLSEQYKSLLHKSNNLFADLDAHTESVLHHMKKIKQKLGITQSNMCTICLEHPINHIITPCNHCYCEMCANKCRTDRTCFICRAAVRSSQKIFID